jgi:hypothetical protein
MAETSDKSRGRILAGMLAGSWRLDARPFARPAAEVEEIAPLLLRSGGAALVWRKVRDSDLSDLPAAQELHQAYRLYALQAAFHQRTIERVFALLRSQEIEPILIKGWAAARLYPETGLRPYGDLDLCVSPGQVAEAEAALMSLPAERRKVDLHGGFGKCGGGDFSEIYGRTRLARLGETNVRVPASEDHLRVLCIHMLREGAWRPLWLCDIAAAVESRPADFDWDRCLGEDRRRADWISCAIALAHELLGADVCGTPAAGRTRLLPRWLTAAVLKEWESRAPNMPERHLAPMAGRLRRPSGILKGLRHRWPNPIEATVEVRGPFNGLPRLPFQLGNCLARTAKFTLRLPQSLRPK